MYNYHTLIAVRECLRQVQQLLPMTQQEEGWKESLNRCVSEFICNTIPHTTVDGSFKSITSSLILRGIAPHMTFNDWVTSHNGRRKFNFEQMQQLRQQWINQLCRDINIEIEKSRPMGRAAITTQTVNDHPNQRHWRQS